MSYRRSGKEIHEGTESWQLWRKRHERLLLRAGLPHSVLCDRDHWYDFLEHGYLDPHDDPSKFNFPEVPHEQRQALRQLLDHDLFPAERVSSLVYRLLAENAEPGGRHNGDSATASSA